MNRNIKFRGRAINAWSTNKKDGDWIYGNLIQNEDASFIAEKVDNSYLGYCNDCDRTFADMYRVDPNTIGQHIGSKDVNGKEVYEGDIVKVGTWNPIICDYITRIGVVKWIENGFVIDMGIYSRLIPREGIKDKDRIEIIGNIFENKELLEGEKK